jgi:glycerol uptake operon antiterminator
MPNILIKKHSHLYSGDFYEMIRAIPVIPAVKAHEEIDYCLNHASPLVFVLYGDILTIPEVVKKIKNAGKTVLVHLDLIDGLKPRDIAIDYLEGVKADGILSAKPNL